MNFKERFAGFFGYDDIRAQFWKNMAIAVGIIFLVALLLALVGRPVYRQLKEKHSVRQAQAFLAQRDYRSAFLSVREALLINSNNVAACQIMAQLQDVAQSPAALAWQKRVVQLEPDVTNQFMLAAEGLRYQNPPFPLTSQILQELASSASNRVEYQVVATELALRMNRPADAQAHLELALQLQPTNEQFQVNLATLHLGSTNPASAELGREELKKFLADTNFAAQALRSLAADRMAHADLSGALNYSTQLVANVQVTVADCLQELNILRALHETNWSAQLRFAQQLAMTNASAAAALASWMIANDSPGAATHWLTNLSASVQSQSPARLALVEGYLAETNSQALMDFTSQGDWGTEDFLRLAFLSHALSQLNMSFAAQSDWRVAVDKTGGQLGSLITLTDLAARWNLPREREELLWQIFQKFPDERGAWQELERIYFHAGNTRKLNELYGKLFSFYPQNPAIKNNLTATALLLKTNLSQAYVWAKENYLQNPNDASVVSTYAYALDLQGRAGEGLAALEKLPPAALEQPSIALYYGVLLAATGQTNQSAHFLGLAQTGVLLPEEKVLIGF
jgi:Flp pilus assembly protein TadD